MSFRNARNMAQASFAKRRAANAAKRAAQAMMKAESPALATLDQIKVAYVKGGVRTPSESVGPQRQDTTFFDRIGYVGNGHGKMTFFDSPATKTAARHTNLIGNGTIPGNSLMVVEGVAARFKPGFDCLGAAVASGNPSYSIAGTAAGTDSPAITIKNAMQQITENCTIRVTVGSKIISTDRGITAFPWPWATIQDGTSTLEGITASTNGFRVSDVQHLNGVPSLSNRRTIQPFMVTPNDQLRVEVEWDSVFGFVSADTTVRGFVEFILLTKFITPN